MSTATAGATFTEAVSAAAGGLKVKVRISTTASSTTKIARTSPNVASRPRIRMTLFSPP